MSRFGVDGCREGWIYLELSADRPQFGVVKHVRDLVDRNPDLECLFIDIPVGLPESGDGIRECDRKARHLLTGTRSSSIFPTPSRQAVYAGSYRASQEANREAVGKGLTKQSWYLCDKIREVDELLEEKPDLMGRIRECHPEVCFATFGDGPMRHSKKTREGAGERLQLLEDIHPGVADVVARAVLAYGGSSVERDDIIDAAAAAVCAFHADEVATLPEAPPKDPRGIPMEMVYWSP